MEEAGKLAEVVAAVGVAKEDLFDGEVEPLDALPVGLAVAGAGFVDDVSSGVAGDGLAWHGSQMRGDTFIGP